MTVADLVALARAIRDSRSPTSVVLADSVIEMFGSLPDWPCGWERSELKKVISLDPHLPNIQEIEFAGGARCTPEEAVAIGLDLFEKGRAFRAP